MNLHVRNCMCITKYCSLFLQTTSIIIPAKTVMTPPNRPIPSCSPKTSTPKRFLQTLEDSLPSTKNNKQVLSEQETREEIPPKEDSSTHSDSVESDFKKVTEKLPNRNRTKRSQSCKASENVHNVKVPSADCGAKGEKNKLSRKPLQNITNKHGPTRKQKKPTVSIEYVFILDFWTVCSHVCVFVRTCMCMCVCNEYIQYILHI